jgi:dimethylamine/trimethylamine dehydrogenase
MARDPRYDILFEPAKIGPITSRNRFYQVPHCTGMGFNWPHARMRGIKAEGGWGVICTEECLIKRSTGVGSASSIRLWDEDDVKYLVLISDAVHEHGALGGVELAHGCISKRNRYSRMSPIGPSYGPHKHAKRGMQPRAMDKADIHAFRRWHCEAALRAKRGGADIVYVYAAHNIALPMHFLLPRYNQRTDEYGGTLENRARLFRELIKDTHEGVGDTCAVALRFAVDEILGAAGIEWGAEGREVVEMLAELPDLWDVNVSGWENDYATTRFAEEGSQEPYIAFVKSLTTKPVVGVGWLTSPDTMASQIKRDLLDTIGAAQPSIADPFPPRKIEEKGIGDIRKCIACNLCVSGNNLYTPMCCTKNPTKGEEWQRGWHLEQIPPRGSDAKVLVMGAGPAGLEAARALDQRGYAAAFAEASKALGGRVGREAALPGLAAWARVRDWRVGQIQKMPNVETYLDRPITLGDVLAVDARHVLVATSGTWRKDGIDVTNHHPVRGSAPAHVLSTDDIMDGAEVAGPVVVLDDGHYNLGGVIAEKLRGDGHEVTLITPAAEVTNFTIHTLEQERVQKRILELGITIEAHTKLVGIERGGSSWPASSPAGNAESMWARWSWWPRACRKKGYTRRWSLSRRNSRPPASKPSGPLAIATPR